MKLVLGNFPDLSVPGGPSGNSMISLTPGSGSPVSLDSVNVTTDDSILVDGASVVLSMQVNVTYYPSGSSSTSKDVITINGTSAQSTADGSSMVLLGDSGTGPASGITAKVISCGQTATSVD